jgi:hypothetical protein
LLYLKPVLASALHCDAIELDHHEALAAEIAKPHNSPQDLKDKFAAIDEHFGDLLREGWKGAHEQWKTYGKREFVSSAGVRYRFDELDAKKQELQDKLDEIDKFQPGLRDVIRREKIEKLPKEQREALEINEAERTASQQELAAIAEQAIQYTPHEVAMKLKAVVMITEYEREHPNYDYWMARCVMEQKPEAREARRLLHHADIYFADADLLSAKAAYEQAFELWRKVLGPDPAREMLEDQTAFMINEKINNYERVLNQLDEPFPKKFVLQDLRDVQSYGHTKP